MFSTVYDSAIAAVQVRYSPPAIKGLNEACRGIYTLCLTRLEGDQWCKYTRSQPALQKSGGDVGSVGGKVSAAPVGAAWCGGAACVAVMFSILTINTLHRRLMKPEMF